MCNNGTVSTRKRDFMKGKLYCFLCVITLFVLLTSPAKADVGDRFYYGSWYHEILSESDLTVACLGERDNATAGIFMPTVVHDNKVYTVTELRYENGYSFKNIDFVSYPPSQYKIKVIGDYVFLNTMVDPNTLPNSIEALGGMNFSGRSDITSVKLPSMLKKLGNSCFSQCRNLKSVEFGYYLEEIGHDAFLANHSLETVTLRCLKKIGFGSFQDCPKLKSIVLPNDLEEIGWSAFYYCTGLTSIVIPENIKVIGGKAFKQCGSLSYILFKPQIEPSYCNNRKEEVAFAECFDEDIESKMYVPSRKTYQHGIEMISFDEDEYTYTGQSPEVSWRNNTLWAVSMITSGLSSSAGDYSKTFVASFADLGQTVKIPYKYTINKAPSELTIHNQADFACLTVGEEVFIEWSCDAPHTSIGIIPGDDGNTSIVDVERVIVYEDGEKVTKYKIVANNIGSCELCLQAYGSPNYEPAIATIAITVERDSEPSTPCSAPTISFADGKLQLTSTTEGASVYYTLDTPDRVADAVAENGEVELTCQYIITAYASAEGYANSDTVTATLYFINKDADDTAIETPIQRGIIVSSTGGFLTISGLDNRESVSIYSLSGTLLSTSTAANGTVTYNGTSGDIVIVKIGEQSIKVQM